MNPNSLPSYSSPSSASVYSLLWTLIYSLCMSLPCSVSCCSLISPSWTSLQRSIRPSSPATPSYWKLNSYQTSSLSFFSYPPISSLLSLSFLRCTSRSSRCLNTLVSRHMVASSSFCGFPAPRTPSLISAVDSIPQSVNCFLSVHSALRLLR